ncbi:hypothetical protein F5Y03DRAFT_235207 [Xylaria venustula]|nr:hypothetical protein F5Y03DRAFT_235207 [Xylaria venustula]
MLGLHAVDTPEVIMADTDQQTRVPLTTFHLFPELPTELRIIIWITAMRTTPLQIHMFVWEDNFVVGAGLRNLGMVLKHMRFQQERMTRIVPFLRANSESRNTTLEQYSFVPFRDLIIHDATITRPEPESLDPEYRNVDFAIDWRVDTVFWNEYCFLPDPALPWAEHLRNATLLCMPIEDTLNLNTEWIRTRSESDDDSLIVAWAQDILPGLSKLKEIIFAIKNWDENEGYDDSDDDYVWTSHEISKWCDRPFVPFPQASVLGSALDGGYLKFNKYPLEPPTDDNSYWWEPLETESMRSIKVFRDEFDRERPGVVLSLALDAFLIAGWDEDIIHLRGDS